MPDTKQLGDMQVEVGVEIDVQQHGKVCYINVDGICALRLILKPGQIITLTDRNRRAEYEYFVQVKGDA